MPDGFSYVMRGVKEVKDALDVRQAKMERGALWALRETGRVAARAAKATAPVYKGKDAITQKAHRAGGAGFNAPVKGLLRSSIKPARKVNGYGGAGMMSLTVGPTGARVQLYRAKIEGDRKFMEAGRLAALAAAPGIWDEAVTRSMNR